MTLSLEHEYYKSLIGRLLELMTCELNIPLFPSGSTTFKRLMLERGLEPEEGYWIKSESAMRGKKEFDIESDPPPDLVVEVDIISSSINRMGIYAAMRVPEVWRFDGQTLQAHVLGPGGKYKVKTHSKSFSFLAINDFARFVSDKDAQDQTRLLRAFGASEREALVPAATKKNGRKPGA